VDHSSDGRTDAGTDQNPPSGRDVADRNALPANGPNTTVVRDGGTESSSPSAGLLDWLLLAVLKAVRVDVELADVRRRAYTETALQAYDIDATEAEFLFDAAEDASKHTDEKVKQLLTVSSALTTLVSVFGREAAPRLVIAGVALFLVVCVILCLNVLSVRKYTLPILEDRKAPNHSDVWAKDLLRSAYANRAAHFFRVDLYRAASRYFVLALVLSMVVIFTPKKSDARIQLPVTSQGLKRSAIPNEVSPSSQTTTDQRAEEERSRIIAPPALKAIVQTDTPAKDSVPRTRGVRPTDMKTQDRKQSKK